MKSVFSVIIIMLLIAILPGCRYDKAELVYPTNPQSCDTTSIRYSTDVVNIISANCYVCHGGTAGLGAGIKLDVHAGLKAMGDQGILLNAITHSPGAPPMPKGGAKLSNCNIAKIRTWLRNGAPNN